MGKTLKYVSEFSFPSDKGYSGSAGKQMVKGYARGGACGPMKKADGGAVDDPRRPLMDRTLPEYIEQIKSEEDMTRRPLMDRTLDQYIGAINRDRLMDRARQLFGNNPTEREMQSLMRGEGRRPISQGLRSPLAEMARERAILGEGAGYKKGGMAMGGQMDRLKGTIGNERREMARVEAKQRDAGQELSRVRSEMRYDKNEMKGMRKQYPTNRSEPMIKMAKGGAAPKSDMLFSKKEVNAKNLLADGKGAPMPHPKGSVNMAKGGQAKVGKVMGEFKEGKLHSGSKSGPVVKSRKQAIAIGLSEARAAKKK